MDESNHQRPSPATSSRASTGNRRGLRRCVHEQDAGDSSCTGKSWQSCTAEAIADCVAVCCCPFAVVNFLALALVRLPWAVARRFVSGRRRRRNRRRLEMRAVGIPEGGRAEERVSTLDAAANELNDHSSSWSEMYEVGHLGFGRISFTGIHKGN